MGWVQIEQNLIPEIPLQSIIFLGKVHWNKIKKQKTNWIQNTLNVWEGVRKKGGGPSSISRAMPIAGNTDFSIHLVHQRGADGSGYH